MQPRESLLKSHLKIYNDINEQIFSYSVSESRNIRKYRSDFTIGKKFQFQESSIRKLLSEINKRRLILVGDFHPFSQSQKGFLRLLKMIPENKRTCVALECVLERHQKKLDAFLNSKITLNELREEIQFDTFWPFSWADYSQILTYCKEKQIPVIGINLKPDRATLQQRDEHAANILQTYSENNPDTTILCLIGDFHLAREHLPLFLKKNRRMLIHQNIDQLFFKAQKRFSKVPEVIRISKDEFCIFNSVPWMKAQSYLDWLEGNIQDSDSSDIHEQIYQFSEILASSLKIKFDRMSEINLIVSPQAPSKLKKSEKPLYRNSLRFSKVVYLPYSNSIYLPTSSSNSKTEAASMSLWRSMIGFSPRNSTAMDKNFLIFTFFIGFLGSKILNPHRKCNEVSDLISIAQHRPKNRFELKRKRICENALFELKKHLPERLTAKPQKLSEEERIQSYRMIGYILANRIYLSSELKKSGIQNLKEFFLNGSIRSHFTTIRKKLKRSRHKPKPKSQTL